MLCCPSTIIALEPQPISNPADEMKKGKKQNRETKLSHTTTYNSENFSQ